MTKFKIDDKVITNSGLRGSIRAVTMEKGKGDKYLISSDNESGWFNENEINIVIDNVYLTE